MLEVNNVSLRLGERTVLNDVSLTCTKGSVTALIGPNGAGKSTLLDVMAGDHALPAGEVRIAGRSMADMSLRELAAWRAVMPQDNVLRYAYKVTEVVAMGRALRDLPPDRDEVAVNRAMHIAEVEHLALRDGTSLSGGEQARATFARVLAQETPVLLLDEPTAALDLRHQERVLLHAGRLAREGCSVVVVLHDLNLASAHADRLVLLDCGQIVHQGPPAEVLEADLLSRVYQQAVCVVQHPQRGCPVVLTTTEIKESA